MAEVSDYLTAPYQGVSQAPPTVRLKEQAEAIQDTGLNLPEGATKRAPLTWLGTLAGHPGTPDGVFNLIERPDGDRILTCTLDAGVVTPAIYTLSTLAAESLTIDPDAQGYLNASAVSPIKDLSVLTVQDFTFLTNRNQIVANSASVAPTRPFEAMIWVKLGGYGYHYDIVVTPDGGTPVHVRYTAPSGAHDYDSYWVETSNIAEILWHRAWGDPPQSITSLGGVPDDGSCTDITLDALVSQGFTVTQTGPVIYLSHPTANFTLGCAGPSGGDGMVGVKDKVNAFSDLPKKAQDGFVVRITNETAVENDDFFVSYNSTAGVDGTWEECIGPGASLGLDPNTMPVGLVNDGGWQLNVMAWTGRTVGDATLNPDPSFIGTALADMTFWRGRLAVCGDEALSLSSANNPFQFYPTTLATDLDGDPVGLLAPTPGISLLKRLIPYGKRLFAFGDKGQVQVHSNGLALTSKSAAADALCSYEYNPTIPPQVSNKRVYFIAPKGDTATAVYELATTSDSEAAEQTDAEDLTTVVPRYIPATVDRVANCPVNYTMLYGESGGDTITYHSFRYAQGERVQNAFDQWNLPDGFALGGMFFKNTRCYMLLIDSESVAHVAMLDLAPNVLDPSSTRMLTHLDLRCREDQVTLSYETSFDETLVTMPYAVNQNLIKAVVRAPGGVGGPKLLDTLLPAPEGYAAVVKLGDDIKGSTPGANQFVLKGNWTEAPMWFGYQYTMRITLSRFYKFDTQNKPLRSGRLSLRRLRVDYADTGYFRVEVTAKGRDLRKYEFTGYRLDDPSSIWNVAPKQTNVFSCPITGQNEQITIDLVNDSHFPCKLLGWEWIGDLNLKASR